MRIAIITMNFPVLSETFISNKVRALSMRGHTVRVFTGSQNKALFNQLFTDTSSVSVVELSVRKAFLYCITYPFNFFKSITQKNRKRYLYQSFRLHAISQFKPDIIHFEFSGVGTEYIFLLNQLECKKVVSCRGSAEKVKLLISQERKTDFARL